jgi:MerR family transcriptional regulator, light-induced transcriptional regulator
VEDVDEPRLTVSGAARRLGIAPGTLRTWDRRYGIGPTEHTRGRHRLYSAADMARLELMQHALVQGASPAEAARYARAALPSQDGSSGGDGAARPDPEALTPPRPELGPVPLVDTGNGAVPAAIDPDERPVRAGGGTLRMPGAGPRARGLGRAALAMDPGAACTLLEESIAADGLVGTWNDVARPVLVAVGQRWATSGRGVEVEHLLSECLIAVFSTRAAGLQATRVPPNGVPAGRPLRPVLLAGMPTEMHVVPLAVLAALLAEHGIGCRSLGPALPADALAAAVRRTAPAVVVLWSQLKPTADTAVIATLPVTRPRFRTYVAGPGWDGAALPAGVSWLGSLTDAIEQIGAVVLR